MTTNILKDVMRLILNKEDLTPLGQAVFYRSLLLVPLHIIDKRYLKIMGNFGIAAFGSLEYLSEIISVSDMLPIVDVALCRTNEGFGCQDELHFTNEIHLGSQVEIYFLELKRNKQVHLKCTTSFIRDILAVGQYEYHSADNAIVKIQDARVLFLSHHLHHGTSGSLVCLASTGQVVGFIHGNADENNGDAICLDPSPLISLLNKYA